MTDYDLSRLGSRAFEQLVTALAHDEIGPGVQAFGDGPDGGREATYVGQINWSNTSVAPEPAADLWDGFTVIQAKYQAKRKRTPHDDAVWLQGEIKDEIHSWTEAARKRNRKRLPDYLIFVTNAELSPLAKIGGIDRIETAVRRQLAATETLKAGLRVRAFRIWHADDLRMMLRANSAVRRAFPALLSAGDILAMLGFDALDGTALEVGGPIRDDVLGEIARDSWIRLGQAGAPGDSRIALGSVVVDVPAAIEDPSGEVAMTAARILEIGDMVLRQKQPDRVERPSFVVVGGPGQGKSTLGQLIAQAYRTSLLTNEGPLGPQTDATVRATSDALKRMGIDSPGNRRWPVRVELPQYAEHLTTGADTSLLRWVSERMAMRGTTNIQPNQLDSWLRTWPWALILDGLDEVPSLEARRLVFDQLDALQRRAEDHDADLLIVITTRPQGYVELFSRTNFEHLYLRVFNAADASRFAKQLTTQRFPDDQSSQRDVLARLNDAINDPETARLMVTPLQVTIMSFIVEKFPNLPPDRYTMFNLYYRTILEREQAKKIPLGKFLMANGAIIDRLHELIGLRLQIAAETDSEAVLSDTHLMEIARELLQSKGFGESERNEVAQRLLDASRERLVLIVPRDDGVGFELRSLQELMAAKAMASGPERGVAEALRLTSHSPHWRNTWLLAAGHLLASGDHWENDLAEIVRTVDGTASRMGTVVLDAPLLAGDVLQDNLAARRPNFGRFLVRQVMKALDVPPDATARQLSWAVSHCLSSESRTVVLDRLRAAEQLGPAQRAAAAVLGRTTALDKVFHAVRVVPGVSPPVTVTLSETEQMAVRNLSRYQDDQRRRSDEPGGISIADKVPHVGVRDYLDALAVDGPFTDDERRDLHGGLRVVRDSTVQIIGKDPGVAVPTRVADGDPSAMLEALDDPELATAVDVLLGMIPPTHWAIVSILSMSMRPALTRLPVGGELSAIVAAYTAPRT
jgi:hypothetical protein